MADPKTTEDDVNTPESETQDAVTEDNGAAAPEVEEAEVLEDSSAEDSVEDILEATSEPNPDPVPAPPPQVIETRRGPGFFPLVLGGIVAAGLGYGAAFMGYLPGQSGEQNADALAAISSQLDGQSATLVTLSDRAETLEGQIAAIPPAPEPVDLSPLADQISGLGDQISANAAMIQGLTDRVAYLETLPLGENGADNSAAIAAAVAQMQAALQEQTSALAEQQAANDGLAEELRNVAAEAEASIAAAQAAAEARVGAATAQAALGQLRIAVATGAPFTSALTDVAAETDVAVPDALQAASEAGVPRIEDLQAAFPTAARAALPIAIRETAGEGTTDRFLAFVQSQVGGRSLEAREGDDPDAILSRAEAALATGDLAGAIAEITALPADAQSAMADWVATAETRLAATEAMDEFTAALDAAN